MKGKVGKIAVQKVVEGFEIIFAYVLNSWEEGL